MKTKNYNKKLVLNKKTISSLNTVEMTKQKAGDIKTRIVSVCLCATDEITNCITVCPTGVNCTIYCSHPIIC